MSHDGRMQRGKKLFDNGDSEHSEAKYYKEHSEPVKVAEKAPKQAPNNNYKRGKK